MENKIGYQMLKVAANRGVPQNTLKALKDEYIELRTEWLLFNRDISLEIQKVKDRYQTQLGELGKKVDRAFKEYQKALKESDEDAKSK